MEVIARIKFEKGIDPEDWTNLRRNIKKLVVSKGGYAILEETDKRKLLVIK